MVYGSLWQMPQAFLINKQPVQLDEQAAWKKPKVKSYAWAGAPTGQVSAHAPHSMHASGLISYLPSPSAMALTGHSAAQAPQLMHSSEIL